MLSRSIQRMIKLERLIIKLISALHDCCFCKQSLFKASSQLPILRILELTSGAACLEALRSFRHLEELTLHINNINAGHLMECCKSNTKLRVLKLCGSGAEGSLEGIAALCNNVEELEILLESNRDYSPFAKLLNLKRLTIYCAQSDLARRFLNGFSTEKLEEIELFRKIYGITDLKLSKKIVSMKALKYLDGYFNDTKCLELLTQLHDLEELFIDVWYDGGFSSSILKIVQVCRKLQILHVGGESFKGNEFVFKVLEVLKKVRDPTTQKPLLLELEHCTALTATEMQKIDHAYLDLYIINYEDYSDTDVLMIV
ncbi:uncharacterized protein LOC115626468 [Scaptodrosophila lebanonensis]|uniref:Uncharacterized protein LOC115626468 n=1 Tax=Drosophila lebanonensis TaxID=7225 RepID=A0A6J2TMC2_DROLE|nr:uncharacterized protein LOC115626468 [Scaptodrosophila lebanonensis]